MKRKKKWMFAIVVAIILIEVLLRTPPKPHSIVLYGMAILPHVLCFAEDPLQINTVTGECNNILIKKPDSSNSIFFTGKDIEKIVGNMRPEWASRYYNIEYCTPIVMSALISNSGAVANWFWPCQIRNGSNVLYEGSIFWCGREIRIDGSPNWVYRTHDDDYGRYRWFMTNIQFKFFPGDAEYEWPLREEVTNY